MRKSGPVATESEEQQALIAWAEMQTGRYPELALLYHVPNGGHRHKATAARLRAEGVKSGVPDIVLPTARGGYHGLYVEMKRTRGGRLSLEQIAWLDALRAEGYMAIDCKGWEDARRVIAAYLRLTKTAHDEPRR